MAKPEKQDNPNKAGGRANAPGQNKPRTFVNDAGETIEGTMQDFHSTLKDQGYRPVEDADDGDDEVETPETTTVVDEAI